MKQIPLSSGLFAIVDDDYFEELSKWKWSAHKTKWGTYARRADRTEGTERKIYMHRIIVSAKPKEYVDHINLNTVDNRIINLRICTNAENSRNQGLKSTNKSGYKGVSWCLHKNKWVAAIRILGKQTYLGSFYNKLDAAKAYNKAAVKHHGSFARINKIPLLRDSYVD